MTKRIVLKNIVSWPLRVGVVTCVSIAGLMNASQIWAQSQGHSAKAEFEVASIRRSVLLPAAEGTKGPSAPCRRRFTVDRSRVELSCFPLTILIATAFNIPVLPDLRITGPDWMGDQRFDISATLPSGASEDQVPEMLKTLLADRFKLITHWTTKEAVIYALVVGPSGPKLKEGGPTADSRPTNATQEPSAPQSAGTLETINGIQFRQTRIPNPNGNGFTILMATPRMGTVSELRAANPQGIRRFEAPSITLEGLAELLTIVVAPPLPFRDMTGIKGRYQVVLEVPMGDFQALMAGPHDPGDAQNALLKAGQDAVKKLGLELVQRKGPVDTLVVDHVEKTPTEN